MALVPYNIPNVDERLEEIITTQFRDQPVIHKFLRLWTAEVEDLFVVWQSLAQDRDIDSATGDVLDIIGRIVGQERTIVGADLYDFFGFRGHIQALGFGDTYVEGVGGRWWSLGAPMGGNVTLDDGQYRLLIKARIMRNTSRGTPEDMLRYIQFVFGVEGKFTWNEGAMARVGVGRKLSNFEKALIAAEFTFQKYPTYYSPKPLGVGLELFEYDSLGTLGFIGTPNAKGMITLSNPTFDGGVFGSVKYFSEIQSQPPTYEADFTKSAVLPANINFTRASTATYFGSDGVLKTAAINEPVFEYDDKGVFVGWRLEESRTNLATYSGSMTTATAWGDMLGVAVSPNTTEIVPDGTKTSAFVQQTTAHTSHRMRRNSGTAYTTGSVYTLSTFMKSSGKRYAGIWAFSSRFGENQIGVFDLQNGVVRDVAGGCTAQIQSVGNGWYRCSITTIPATSTGTSGSDLCVLYSDDGSTSSYTAANETDGVLVWGGQIEVGGAVSSYIPTIASAVTRAAEVPRSSPLALPFDGFTAYVECSRTNTLGQYPLMFSDAPTSLGNYVGSRLWPSIYYVGSTEGVRTGSLNLPQLRETMRLAFTASNVPSLNRAAVNGVLSPEMVITPGTVNFSQRNILKIGATNSAAQGTFYIKKYAIYTTVFSEDQLNYLTYAG